MKTSDIIAAIDRLNRAGSALNCGNLSIEAQMKLGSECHDSASRLRFALERELPFINLEAA